MNYLIERRRQLLHLFFGAFLIALIYFNLISKEILLALALFSISLSLIHLKFKIPPITWLLNSFERRYSKKILPGQGYILFLIGALIPFYILSKRYALASLAVLTVGDSIAPLTGIFLGKINLPFNKSKKLEGLVAGTFSSFLFASIFINPLHAIIVSSSSMFFESLKLKVGKVSIDDNLLIPFIATVILFIISKI